MKKVAIIGTVGVPAAYGGFETMVDNIIGDNASCGVQYTIFCSSQSYPTQLSSYRGAQLKYIPLKANGVQSIAYDVWSLLRAIRGYDVVVALGVSGGLFFPLFKLLSRSRLIVNIDGLEWRRAKWGRVARGFLRLSESVAVGWADVVVADNGAIVEYVAKKYRRSAVMIAYGGDHVVCEGVAEDNILADYGVARGEYAMSLCRVEPENNCEMILQSAASTGTHLLFVGNWNRSKYGRELKRRYSKYPNIRIIEALYQRETLYALRHCCRCYIHGHSAGGTNPSLVEAMFCGCNIIAYDVVYNRETTENRAAYFIDGVSLSALLNSSIPNRVEMQQIAQRRYRWRTIAEEYESLY